MPSNSYFKLGKVPVEVSQPLRYCTWSHIMNAMEVMKVTMRRSTNPIQTNQLFLPPSQ